MILTCHRMNRQSALKVIRGDLRKEGVLWWHLCPAAQSDRVLKRKRVQRRKMQMMSSKRQWLVIPSRGDHCVSCTINLLHFIQSVNPFYQIFSSVSFSKNQDQASPTMLLLLLKFGLVVSDNNETNSGWKPLTSWSLT